MNTFKRFMESPDGPKDGGKTVPEMLEEAAEVYRQRNELYKDNYLRFGEIMQTLFPDGLFLGTKEEFNRFGIFVQCVAKLTRYGAQFNEGGHDDSALDASVYFQMLRQVDNIARQPSEKEKS